MLASKEEAEAGAPQTASWAALLPMLQQAEAPAGLAGECKSQEPERRATPHRTPLPCMFSGICPCSPCDRTSPGASVSTLGSMTRRLRAGMGRRCRSGSPAPGHGQQRFNSSGKREGVISVPAHPPARRSCRAGPRSPVRSGTFKAVPELSAGDPGYQARLRRPRSAARVPLRKGGGSNSKALLPRTAICARRAPEGSRGGRQLLLLQRLNGSRTPSPPAPALWLRIGRGLSLLRSPHFSSLLYCPLLSPLRPFLLSLLQLPLS